MKSFLICLSALVCFSTFAQNNNCNPTQINITAEKFTLEYNENGQLAKVVDRNENVYKLSYNEKGDLTKSENLESDGALYDTYIYKVDTVEQHDEDGLYLSYIYEKVDGNPVKISKRYVDDDDSEIVSELVWKDGNVIEQSTYKKGVKTTYQFEYDDKPNVLSVLRFYVDFSKLLNYAEMFSKNNMVKVTANDSEYDLTIEYNEQGCVYKTARNHRGIYKEITY